MKIHLSILHHNSHLLSIIVVDDYLLSSWEKLSDEPEGEVDSPQELVGKVSNEDDGDAKLGRVSGHETVGWNGVELATLGGEEEVHEEGDTPDGEDKLHEQHHKDGGQVPGLLGADHSRVQLDHRAPDVEHNIEETEKVEAVTEN